MPIGRLNPGESHEIEMVLSFLAHGRFEIAAHARARSTPDSEKGSGSGSLSAVVREET